MVKWPFGHMVRKPMHMCDSYKVLNYTFPNIFSKIIIFSVLKLTFLCQHQDEPSSAKKNIILTSCQKTEFSSSFLKHAVFDVYIAVKRETATKLELLTVTSGPLFDFQITIRTADPKYIFSHCASQYPD